MLIVRGSYLFEPTVSMAEFRGVWAGIAYAQMTLCIDHLIIEEDLATIVT